MVKYNYQTGKNEGLKGMSLGKRLILAREKAGLLQKEAAEKIGINNSVLSRYEADERRPDPETLTKIASVYKVTTDYLLGLTNDPSPSRQPDKSIDLATLNYVQIGSRIKEAREAMGLSQAELGDKIGQSELTVRSYEKGKRKISIEDLEKIAKALQRPLDLLAPDLFASERHEPDILIPTKKIPLVGRIRAGSPGYATQEKLGEITVSKYIDADFGLLVKGDSMIEAGINPGDIAVCKKTEFAEHGDIVAALVNGDDTTLKYLINEDGEWKLRAANPKYPDIALSQGDGRIQGVVVTIQKRPSSYKRIFVDVQEGDDWNDVIQEAAKYGITREAAKRLIKSFGRLKEGLPEDD